MTTQSEDLLEKILIKQLIKQGYELVTIKDDAALTANLKTQLETHNNTTFSDKEFKRILNHLNKGTIFERAHILRRRMELVRDNGDNFYVNFLNIDEWCQNQYQVTNQVSMTGKYKNRYDVTLLINGFPLVQIELKKRGLGLKGAFNQTIRYHKHSYGGGSGLFRYIQVFVISNGVNTKYYANNRNKTYEQTYTWATPENKKINELSDFTTQFLERCHLSKMICKYIVLNETLKILMVLRPYQYHATEALVKRVSDNSYNGYVWHTTGSGKTLTSFKAAQTVMNNSKIFKVLFVVDRKDLDYQTMNEFNAFRPDSVSSTTNTQKLIEQFKDDTKLIVTTIQKLNNAISRTRYKKQMAAYRDQKIVFIFDECHRSQFGDTHKRITEFFHDRQLFGFTGTPILEENAYKNDFGKRTTAMLFGIPLELEKQGEDKSCLHKYVISDAIGDQNVLKFSVEYVGRYKRKNTANETNIDVEAIDTREVMEAPKRLHKIADYIIQHHRTKTHEQRFNALFCTPNIKTLIKYYDYFYAEKQAGKHQLKIATIFSAGVNEDQDEEDHLGGNEEPTPHTREKLDQYMEHYNQMFNTKYSAKDSKSFDQYYKDVSKRVKNRDIDILLVVNMFLTGFDSPSLNTLYVDKNLKHHGLIQAYSRTNRTHPHPKKSSGKIVVFRNLKKKTDEAVKLFSNKEASEYIFLPPYETLKKDFEKALEELREVTPTHQSVDELPHEDAEADFVKAFRALLRIRNEIRTHADFSYDNINITEQEIENYQSKYTEINRKVRQDRQKEKVSILDEIDFEMDLIRRDEINVAYILRLLGDYNKEKQPKKRAKQRAYIDNLLNSDIVLRSKKELIEEFIERNLPLITDPDNIIDAFDTFWQQQQQKALTTLCNAEQLNAEQVEVLIKNFLYTNRLPTKTQLINSRLKKPKFLERKSIGNRLEAKFIDLVETFFDGMGE